MASRRIAVAYSAGRDSTALLHATLAVAADSGMQVVALHVHHGLNADADAWHAHAQAQCARWRRRGWPVEFAAHRVETRPAPGDSVEAWARAVRYAALSDMALAHRAPVVLLAHHRRDQAETVLLQALRGAGLAGLSGMPRRADREGVTWLRPWLDRPRETIDAYVRRHRLSFVDDASNVDPRFARNRLRTAVWPALTAAFTGAEGALAASACWAQQANVLLDEIAAEDLAVLCEGPALLIEPWSALSASRRANALRAWLRRECGAGAPATLVLRLLDELPGARSARWPAPTGELRAHRGLLRLEPAGAPGAPLGAAREAGLSVQRAGRYALPGWGGALQVSAVREGGVPMAWLARLELRERAGAERFQAAPLGLARSLKKQYQAAGVPAWERGGPLVFSGGQLVFAPGLGLDARVVGLAGQRLATLRWLPDTATFADAGRNASPG